MPVKGLEKRGGVPPSPRLWRDKLSQGKRTDPAKGLFPLLKYRPLLGTEQTQKSRLPDEANGSMSIVQSYSWGTQRSSQTHSSKPWQDVYTESLIKPKLSISATPAKALIAVNPAP